MPARKNVPHQHQVAKRESDASIEIDVDQAVRVVSQVSDFPDDIVTEIERQDDIWGLANKACDSDRWLEIATDEWNDLRWACRTRAEVPGHTIAKERKQLIAVLIRWHLADL